MENQSCIYIYIKISDENKRKAVYNVLLKAQDSCDPESEFTFYDLLRYIGVSDERIDSENFWADTVIFDIYPDLNDPDLIWVECSDEPEVDIRPIELLCAKYYPKAEVGLEQI